MKEITFAGIFNIYPQADGNGSLISKIFNDFDMTEISYTSI
jgi:hypothetical protein